MTLYEPGGWLGAVITGMNNITGSQYLTFLLLGVILACIMIFIFKVPFEYTLLSLFSIILTLLAYSSEWLLFFGLTAILFALIIASFFMGGG